MRKRIVSVLAWGTLLVPAFALESYYEDQYLRSVDVQALRAEIVSAQKAAHEILPQWQDAAKREEILMQRLRIFRRLMEYIRKSADAPVQPDGLLHARRGAGELRLLTEYFRRWQRRKASSRPLKRWNVKEFGAKGDGRNDDGPAFRKMLDEIAKHPEARNEAEIPSGTYFFASAPQGDRTPVVDVMSRDRKESMFLRDQWKAHLRLRNLRDVTLRGSGRVLFLFGDAADSYGIRVDGCENVKVENITIDYPELPFTQGTVVSLNPRKNTLTMKKDAGYPDPDGERFLKANSRRSWTFHPETKNFLWDAGTKFLGKIRNLGNGEFEVEIKRSARGRAPLYGLSAGQKIGIVARYNGSSNAVTVTGSMLTTISNLTVYSSPGGAFSSAMSSDSRFLGCRVLPKPGSGRLISTNADGLQAAHNFIGPVVKNCNFSGMFDDALMITTRSSEIEQVSEDAGSAVVPSWNFFDGAECAVINSATGKIRKEVICTAVRPSAPRPPRKIRLEFAAPLPSLKTMETVHSSDDKLSYFNGGGKNLRFGDTLLCLSRSNSGAVITGNTFGPNHGHGINLQAPNALIENNLISGVEGAGIMLSSLGSWFETLVPHNIVISGNRIEGSGVSLVSMYQLMNRKNANAFAPIRFILCEKNSFLNPRSLAFSLSNTDDICFEGNRFRISENVKKQWSIFACGAVKWLDGNSGLKTNPGSMEIAVKGEKIRIPAGKISDLSGGVETAENKMIAAANRKRSAPGSLVPGSVKIRWNGKLLQRGKDYLLNEYFCRIGMGSAPSFPLNAELELEYRYRLRRIDAKVRFADGRELLLKGVPHINIPRPPRVPEGAVLLANYFHDYGTGINAPLEYALRKDRPETGSTRGRIPRTVQKLRRGGKVKIVCWGDSVTDGGEASAGNAYPAVFERLLKEKFPAAEIQVKVVAVGGSTTLNWLDPEKYPMNWNSPKKPVWQYVADEKPDLITLEFVNDAGYSETTFRKCYSHILKLVRELNSELIVITPHFTNPRWMRFQTLRDRDSRPYVKFLKHFADRNHFGIADVSGRWFNLQFEGIPYVIYLANSLNHPLDAGHRLFAEELMKNFEQE